jgi:uncharacterized protein YndB with AHSA1/START domain
MEILSKAEGKGMTHKELVAYLDKIHGLTPWWCQMVASTYEKHIGRREVGQTADAGFEIGVSRTLTVSVEKAWQFLMSPKGLEIWLALSKAEDSLLSEGQTYRTDEGASGEVRVFKPGSHVRLTWQPGKWKKPSTIQIRVTPGGQGKTTIRFHQENLPDAASRETMRLRWKEALKEIGGRISLDV